MGCCVSSHEKKSTPKNKGIHEFPCVSKSPPIAEEEAVKEVLSETPKPKLRPGSRPESPKPELGVEDEEIMKSKLMLLTPKKPNSEQKLGTKHPDPITPEEISEVSENMCSFSESISNNTLKDEDDHLHQFYQQKQIQKQKQNQNPLIFSSNTKDTAASGEFRQSQRVFRSQGHSGNFTHHGQQQQQLRKSQGRSPARRRPDPESSPARRRCTGPVEPKKEMAAGVSSGRRSQSPAKRANVGRSPSTKRTGPSPGRVRMVGGPESGRGVKAEEGKNGEEEEWQGPKESLENPLVSLECFIFL